MKMPIWPSTGITDHFKQGSGHFLAILCIKQYSRDIEGIRVKLEWEWAQIMDKKGRHTLHGYYRQFSANNVNMRQTKSSKKRCQRHQGQTWEEMLSVQWKEKVQKSFHTQCKPFSAKTRSKLCKMQSEIHVFKAVEQTVSKNRVSPMDWKSRENLQYALQTILSKNEVKIMQNTERKEVLKALDSNLIEIGVSVMDVNCTKSCHWHYRPF